MRRKIEKDRQRVRNRDRNTNGNRLRVLFGIKRRKEERYEC